MPKPALMTALLASTALALLLSPAYAEAATPEAGSMQLAAATAPTSSRTTSEEVVIHAATRKTTGGGLIKAEVVPKAISTVSSAFIQTQASIQNAYQYVQLTPGALVSMTDPYGLNEQFSLNIHGLGQDELGYVLEGMPLNDIGFYTAYPAQFIDSENFDEISLAQGSADLDSPVISAAGGLMTLTMLDPSLHAGGLADVGYGSYKTDREFLRLDTGLIGDTGLRGFASYSHTASDNWHGPGRGERQHMDFKIVREWGENRIAWSGEWHDGETPLYVEPTLSNFQKFGADGAVNNYAKTFNPNDAAGGADYYKLHEGTFRIFYTSIPSRFKLADNLTLNVTPYYQYGYGNGPYGSSLSETGNLQGGYPSSTTYDVAIPNYVANNGAVMANYTDLQYRAGVVAKLTYTVGPNDFIVGFWNDYSDETDTQSYEGLGLNGDPANLWGDGSHGFIRLPNGQLLLQGEDHVITKTNEPFVADTLHLMDDKLTIEMGFKEAFVSRIGTNGVPPQYRLVINNTEPLPRAAVRYKIDEHNQVFANVTTNFRTPSEATFFPFYFGGVEYTGINANLKPEYSTSEDIGYRYTDSIFTASATFFYYYFTNRQIATLNSFNVNESVNAGSQTTYGLDLEAGTRPWHHISPYASVEFLHSVDDSNFTSGGAVLPTKGKTSVRSPKVQAALGLSYDDGTFFGNFNAKYVDSQYSTYINDESIPSYITANLSVGVRLPPDGLKARPELKLNLINLTGQNYLASVASPTPSATIASPTYYLSGGQAVLFTATQAF